MVPENRPDGNTLQHGSGEVWVEGGKVLVKNPSGTGRFPTITPCQGIDLLVNGKKVEGKTAVSENDEIFVVPHSVEEPGSYKIRVAPGGLTATLELKAGTVTRYAVQDCKPESDLVLKADKVVTRTCPFNLSGIMQEMAAKNISFGIKHSVLQDLLARPEDGLYLIAVGEPPGGSLDERVELNFSLKAGEHKLSTEDDRVDLRDMFEVPSVGPGALLAVKHSGMQGIPGRKVTGEIIPPAKPRALELKGGKGVEISPCGHKAYARVGGRPVARKTGDRYIIDVEPVLQHKGDVDISSGNIRFKGDVVVHGNVSEGMTVQAAGKIEIKGMVFQAKIAAQGDIYAGQNITSSIVVAGGNNSYFRALHKVLGQLQADLSEASGIVPALARDHRTRDAKTGQLIQLLIDKKYPRVPGLIAELARLSSENAFILPREMALLLEKIERSIGGLNLLKLDSIEELEVLLLEMKDVQGIIEGMARGKASVAFGYAINSKIEATGDVRVGGRGCINTFIRAGGNVNIRGVFRGGEIVAGGDVVLNEAGSELGVRTLVKTVGGKKVYARKAFAGLQIQIGDRRANLASVHKDIRAELDEAGSLVINPAAKV